MSMKETFDKIVANQAECSMHATGQEFYLEGGNRSGMTAANEVP